MSTILGIEVPTSFEGLPADQVTDLVDTVRQTALEVLRSGAITPAQSDECEQAAEFVRGGKAYLQALTEAEDEANDRLDALEDELAADDEDEAEDGDSEDDDGIIEEEPPAEEAADDGGETPETPDQSPPAEPGGSPQAAAAPIRRR